jgi:hypothetical protein
MDTEKGQALTRALTAATPLTMLASSDVLIAFERHSATP